MKINLLSGEGGGFFMYSLEMNLKQKSTAWRAVLTFAWTCPAGC